MCSPQQAPVQEQKTATELPDWAKPYAKDILSKGQALTDVNQNPYQQYTQPRTAGFSPMQQNAMQDAKNMTVTPQTGDATAGANMAGLGGLGVAGQATTQGFQNQMGGYMNPYMSQILAPQLAEANRNYDIGATRQQGAATQAGAFGGSREAIMAAENERNRNTGLNQIYGQGMNTAFGNAQNQYNQNMSNQLQGYGLMNQSAANLGQLGQNQYGQQMGINQLQNQYGTAQQNLAQTGLNTAYQDFQAEKNYPYKQLGFMSDMVRGLPLGQQSTSQMYQGPPTALQTVGALGMGAYGMSKLASGGLASAYADGGDIQSYAGDQGSVTSSGNIEAIISRLNPQQLQQAKQSALARGDMPTVEAIDTRLMELASEKSMTQGIAGAMPQQMADGVVNAAGGGILAFAVGGSNEASAEGDEVPNDGDTQLLGAAHPAYLAKADRRIDELSAFKPTQRTGIQRNSDITDRYALEKGLSGPDTAGDAYTKLIEEAQADRPKALSESKGLAALSAMNGMLQGNSFVRGIGQAGGAFAQTYAPALQADRKEKLALGDMQFKLTDAQRKERMGMMKSAIAASAEAEKSQREADKATFDAIKAKADASVRLAAASRASRGAGAGGGEKEYQLAARVYKAELKRQFPEMSEQELDAKAFQKYQNFKSPGTAGADVKNNADAYAEYRKMQHFPGWRKHVKANYPLGPEGEKAAREDFITDFRNGTLRDFSGANAPSAKAPAPASNPKVIKLD